MKKILVIISIILITITLGCNETTEFSNGDDGDGGSTDDSVYSVDQGWDYFSDQYYNSARDEFNGVIDDNDSAEEDVYMAYVGLGMCDLVSSNYNSAYSNFNQGLSDEFSVSNNFFSDYEKWACIGMLYCKAESTSGAQTVYSKYPVFEEINISWNFPHNNSDLEITGINIYTLLAQMFVNISDGTDNLSIDLVSGDEVQGSNGRDDYYEYAAFYLNEVVNYSDTINVALTSKAQNLISLVEDVLNININ